MQNKVTMEQLINSPMGGKLQGAFDTIFKLQESLVSENADEAQLQKQKIGTVLIFALIEKAQGGKNPKEFNIADWKDIAEKISDVAINDESENYCIFVFTAYADFIDASLQKYGMRFSDETKRMISDLSKEIRENTNKYKKAEIDEVTYTEECLWISLDAMFKLLSATIGSLFGKAGSDLLRAIASLSFEYARYMLYKKENEILAGYLENQKIVDEELSIKYESFCEDIESYSKEFQQLLNMAFEEDFRKRIVGSVELARRMGVEEKEILKTVEEIDEFFL